MTRLTGISPEAAVATSAKTLLPVEDAIAPIIDRSRSKSEE